MPVESILNSLPQPVRPYDVKWEEVFPHQQPIIAQPEGPGEYSPFDSFFNAAMDALEETNSYSLIAHQQQNDLAAGKTSDILGVLLAQDKAYSSMNFTVQVTNKIIESYREIMRMQI